MLLGLMRIFELIFLWTWFAWPFVLIFSLCVAIEKIVKDKGFPLAQVDVASVALLVIISGIISPLLNLPIY